MLYAMSHPDTYAKKGKETLPFSKMRVSQARTVLRAAPELAKAVVAGIRRPGRRFLPGAGKGRAREKERKSGRNVHVFQ